MAVLKPFKAFRPQKEQAQQVASRPYDVLNAAEAREEAAGNDVSFLNVIKPEIGFDDNVDPYGAEIYTRGKANFDQLVQSGVMNQDETENLYIYRLTMNGHTQTGIVGCNAIDEYFNNTIKKHELTRPDKEEDRKNHVRVGKMNAEPVFFSYPAISSIDEVVNGIVTAEAEYDFTAEDGIRHELWVVNNRDTVAQLTSLFDAQVPAIYVADGHHRTAAGALVGKEFRDADGNPSTDKRYNYFMAVLFPDNQLKIIDYNRVVKDLNGLSSEEFMQKLEANFEVEAKDSTYKPEALHTIGMYMDNSWYKLTAKEGTYDDSDPVGVLDVTILSKQVLEPVLNIVDLRRDKRIEFVGGIRGLGELEKRVNSGEMRAAFAMYPVSMQQLIDISDNDLIMPPKVTWFEPKLRSGLFVHSLED